MRPIIILSLAVLFTAGCRHETRPDSTMAVQPTVTATPNGVQIPSMLQPNRGKTAARAAGFGAAADFVK